MFANPNCAAIWRQFRPALERRANEMEGGRKGKERGGEGEGKG